MNYNVYYKTQVKSFNIPNIQESDLYKVIDAYEKERKQQISGTTYDFRDVIEFRIFEHSNTKILFENFRRHCSINRLTKDGSIPPEHLTTLGLEVTTSFLKSGVKSSNQAKEEYVSSSRIDEVRKIRKKSTVKLVALLEELNKANVNSMIHAQGMLLRAVIDHIPPFFDLKTFDQVASNYSSPGNSRSFKEAMIILQNFKPSADSMLHSQSRDNEVLATNQQVKYRGQLDMLLQEIIRIDS